MQTRSITIDLVLNDKAAKIFDLASYKYDSSFTDELSEVIADCVKSQTMGRVSQLVIDVAEASKAAHDAIEHGKFKDLVAEYGVVAL